MRKAWVSLLCLLGVALAPCARADVVSWEVVTDIWVHDVPGPPEGDFWDSVMGNLLGVFGNAATIYPDVMVCARPMAGGNPKCTEVCWDLQGDTTRGAKLASVECKRPLRLKLPPNDPRVQIEVLEMNREGNGQQVHAIIARNVTVADPGACPHTQPCEMALPKGTLALSFGTQLQGTAGSLPSQPPAVAPPTTARCLQPSTTWTSSEISTQPKGLHGPYGTLNDAMRLDSGGGLALQLTASGKSEYGYLILRDQRLASGGYYSTPPVRSSQDPNTVGRPVVTGEDFMASWKKAFENSCADIDQFGLVATVHTHPDMPSPSNNFSADDFNQAITEKKRGPAFEKIFMISAIDRKVRVFEPRATDKEFNALELWTASSIPQLVPKWHRYADDDAKRVFIFGKYP